MSVQSVAEKPTSHFPPSVIVEALDNELKEVRREARIAWDDADNLRVAKGMDETDAPYVAAYDAAYKADCDHVGDSAIWTYDAIVAYRAAIAVVRAYCKSIK